jgi:segregation and condensation protein B
MYGLVFHDAERISLFSILMDENAWKIGELEALLFAASRPLSVKVMAKRLEVTEEQTLELVLRLREDLTAANRGLQLREMGGNWRIETKPEHADVVQSIRAERGERALSSQALETLAVIALRQPVTTDQISAIRGLDSGAAIETLRQRKMIAKTQSRGAGKATCWRTTQNFLDLFGLSCLEDLYRDNKLERVFGPVYGTSDSRNYSAPDDSQSQ